MPLRIGIAIVPVPAQAGAGSVLDAAARAEAGGADVVWILGGERMPDPERLQIAAQVIASTRTIRIGLGPLAWPPESWLRTAEDLATLDALSGGRIEVVLRLPGPGSAFDWAAAGEDLDLLHRAWQAGPVEHESPRHRITGVDVHPKPAQPEGPPIWLAVGDGAGVSREESAAVFARRHGAGLLWESPFAPESAPGVDGGPREMRRAVLAATPIRLDRSWMAEVRDRALAWSSEAGAALPLTDWIEAVRSDSGGSRGSPPL